MIAGFAACDEAALGMTHMNSLPASGKSWRQRCEAHFGVPRKTDLMLLAEQDESVCGAIPITRMTRLVQDLPAQPIVKDVSDIEEGAAGLVWFEFSGHRQTGRRPRVYLKVQAIVALTCQRCMGEMPFVVDETVEFELFASEVKVQSAESAEEVDPDAPEPLVADSPLDLLEIIEDQLILAIPYVPKHEACEPAKLSAGEPAEPVKRESPFKVLESLKRSPK